MFKDEVTIFVRAGKGGRGCLSFRREKFAPKGGPDGGNGGQGGDVVIRTNPHLNTLFHLIEGGKYYAENGQPGGSNNCTGKNGQDLILEVPPGTIIRDAVHRNILKDLKDPSETIVITQGGRGGRGNKVFATPTYQTPREVEPGKPGEERHLYLELKLIADVGLVGLPNAGKSLLLRRLSAARPKVADYPFTTLEPSLGILRGPEYRTLVLADLPGLIAGAHAGKGLGDKFLRHIERTGLILHIIDASSTTDPVETYQTIRNELKQYSPALAKKPEIIVANKLDLPDAEQNYRKFKSAKPRKTILPISALKKTGLEALARLLFKRLS